MSIFRFSFSQLIVKDFCMFIVFFYPDDSDVDEAVMPCMEIDSDDESDDYIDVVM